MEKVGGTGAGVYYYLRNRQGSVLALAAVDGSVAESYRYSAYGKARLFGNDGTEIAVSALGNPYGYTGRRLDPESGLLYYRNRYYSPELGRLLTRDPAGTVDGPNRYAYVRGNPLAFVDPWGLSARAAVDQFIAETDSGYIRSLATTPPFDLNSFLSAPRAEPYYLPTQPWERHGGGEEPGRAWGNTLEVAGSVGQMAWGVTEGVLAAGYIAKSGGLGLTAGGWALAVDASSNVAGGGTRLWNLLTGDSRPDADLVGQGFRTAATEVGLPPAAGDIARATASMATLSALQSVTYAQQQANLQAALRAPASGSAGGGTTSLYHKGELDGGVSPSRTLSTTQSSESAAGYVREGRIYRFDVPDDVYLRWERDGLVQPFRDMDLQSGGRIVNDAVDVFPPASGQLNQYKHQSGGG